MTVTPREVFTEHIIMPVVDVFQCRRTFHWLQNKHRPYVPVWTYTPSPGHHWTELAEALPPESEVCGHRAWPLACIHTDQGKKKKRGWGTQRWCGIKRDIQTRWESERESEVKHFGYRNRLTISQRAPLADIKCWDSAHSNVCLKKGGNESTIGPIGETHRQEFSRNPGECST